MENVCKFINLIKWKIVIDFVKVIYYIIGDKVLKIFKIFNVIFC